MTGYEIAVIIVAAGIALFFICWGIKVMFG